MSLAGIAKETLSIIERGDYVAPSGRNVRVRELVDAAVRGTVLYRPADFDVAVPSGSGAPRIEVTSESTAEASRRLVEAEAVERPVMLNFASAKNPGGGFIGGAKAQEEDLARCSALYRCQLECRDYYDANRRDGSMLYTDHMIYSPDVPFFRDDRYDLLEVPFVASVITAPAPNAGEADRNGRSEGGRVVEVLRSRATKVLTVAAARRHRVLVLGAWGCGVFRNDPREVASAFAAAIETLPGAFDRIVFGIWERDPLRPTMRAFSECFGV